MDQFTPEKRIGIESEQASNPEGFEQASENFGYTQAPETPAEKSAKVINFPTKKRIDTLPAQPSQNSESVEALTPDQAREAFNKWRITPGRFDQKMDFLRNQSEGTDDPENQISDADAEDQRAA